MNFIPIRSSFPFIISYHSVRIPKWFKRYSTIAITTPITTSFTTLLTTNRNNAMTTVNTIML